MALILVIEDSPYVRKLLRDVLEADGHTILEAKNGLQGLQLAATEAPDCILLDLILPDIDGLKVLGNFRERGLKCPVIIVTAHIVQPIRKQCLAFGASAFIGKPPMESQLRYAVKEALASRTADPA